MKDENKTKVELIKELKTLRKERGESTLDNITERKQIEIREKQLVTKMDFLYKTALDFIQLDPKDDIYRFIGRKLKEIVGNSIVLANSYDKASDSFHVCALEGVREKIKKVLKIIGKDLFAMSFPINNEEAKNQLISGELLKVSGGLYELTFGQIPKSICHVLEKFLNVGEIYFSGFAKGKELFGNTIIILPKKVELNNREFINTFIKQAAIALQKKQAEEGLKDSEERLKILFYYAPDAYYISDLKGNFIDGNKAAERVIGYKREELIGSNFLKLKLLSLADIAKAAKLLVKNLRGQPTGPDEFVLNRKDNSKVTVEISTFPVKIKGRALALGLARDITERKQAEEEIKSAVAKWQTTFDAMNDAVSLMDYNGIVLQCNQSYLNLLGKTETEILGKHCWEIVHGTNEPIDGCPFVKMKKSLQRESMLLPIDDKWFNVAVDPIFDANNNLIKAVHIMTDITERKQAESEIQMERDKLTAIFESMVDGIYIVNKDYDIQYVNHVLKKTFGSPEGKKCHKYFHDSDEPCTFCKNEEVFAGKTVRWEWTSSKVGRTYDLIDTPFKNADGSISKLEIFRDITERKQSEEALLESEKKYSSVVENSKDGIIVVQKGIIKFLNQAVLDLTGYNSEELIDKEFESLLSPEYRQLIIDRYQARLAGEETPSIYEIEVIRKDGISVPIEVSNTTIIYGGEKATLSFIRNITERKQAEEKEREHQKNIKLLSEAAIQLVDFPQNKDIYIFIGEKLKELTGENTVIIVNSIDIEKDILVTRTVLGLGKLSEKIVGILGRHPVGMTFDAKDEILSVLSDGKLHLNKEGLYGVFLKTVPKAVCNSLEKLLNIKKIYGVGFTRENKLFGNAVIFLKEDAGELKNKQTIETFIKQASIAIQRRQAEERLKNTLDAAIQTMSKIIEVKDPYTAGHQQRVSQLTTAIAKELNLFSDRIEGIRIASLIHDIGKIGVPTEILSKTTTLSDIEFSLIKGHSQAGSDILKAIDFSYPVANIVLQHHERLDGSGYPNELKGDKILLEARIIGVADVVEAMSSHRPYRPSLGIDAALEEISQNRDILYDPKVVDICLRLFKEKKFKFE